MRHGLESIPFANLKELNVLSSRIEEKRLFELSELSHIAAEQILEGKISLETPYAFSDAVRFRMERERDAHTPKDYASVLEKSADLALLLDTVAFSAFLSKALGGALSPFPKGRKAQDVRIAYIPSPISEQAYKAVSAYLRKSTVLYVGGAEEACASVLASDADGLLLPIARGGERIAAIERLTERYKLYMSAIIPVYGTDGQEMLYAFFTAQPTFFESAGGECLELLIQAESYEAAMETASLLSAFGYDVSYIAFSPLDYGRVRARIALVGDGDESALWFFLSLCTGEFFVLGRYRYLLT